MLEAILQYEQEDMDYAKYQKVKSNNCSENIEELTNIDFVI